MFKLFSRSRNSSPGQFDFLRADMHSHLLPGIDDGAPDMRTAIELIRGMVSLGYSKLITTPHIMWDMYKNRKELILEKLELVRTELKAQQIDVELHAAAEYFLDDHVAGLLKNNEPLLPISGNMVLVEFSLAYPSHSLRDILFEMQMQGYLPVIAHPERYIYLQEKKEFYEELKVIGCLFQMNILSLTGHYGKSVQDMAMYLVKKDYYDLVGTDLHHQRHLEALKSNSLVQQIQKLFPAGRLRNPDL
jgi:protein-tyrosine phosphatase